MQNNKWVPQVLKDVEKYCHENDLQEVAFCLEDARPLFKRLQDEEISAAVRDNDNVEPLRLVWSKPDKQEKVGIAQS